MPIRIVIAKVGLDGHERGAKIVARALREAGMEVIYTGLHQSPEQVVSTVLEEDARGVGVSIHSGAHMAVFDQLLRLLEDSDAGDVLVFGGGVAPEADIEALKLRGLARFFTPGSSTSEIVHWVRSRIPG